MELVFKLWDGLSQEVEGGVQHIRGVAVVVVWGWGGAGARWGGAEQ